MSIGGNACQRLGFPHARGHRQPRVDDQVGTIAPDKNGVSLPRERSDQRRCLAALLVQGYVAPDMRPAREVVSSKKEISRTEAYYCNQQRSYQNQRSESS